MELTEPMENLPIAPLLQAYADIGTEGYLAFDRQYRYIFWSKGMEEMTGLSGREVLGRNAFEIFPFLRKAGVDRYYSQALAGQAQESSELEYSISETGRSGYFKSRYSPLRDQSGRIIGGVALVSDVTEQTLSRQMKEETENRFKNMADHSPVMLWMSGVDGLCNFFNHTWLQFTGRKLEDELGVGWAEGVYFEDFQRCIDIYLAAFNSRRAFEMEYRLKRADGTFRWILDRAAPRYTPDGTFTGFIGSCIDITERKQLEVELREAVTSREEFLSIASHELKTPLTSLGLQLGIFEHLLKGKTPTVDLLDRMESVAGLAKKQIRVLTSLIDALLDVSRASASGPSLEIAEVDLAEAVDEVMERSRQAADQKGSDISWERGSKVTGYWDKSRIEQVISNLVTNAIKYGEGKPIEVRVSDEGKQAVFSVRDQGFGIAPEHQGLIFQKFHRTKFSKGVEGLGLGLYISQQIVDAHGGKIKVISEVGLGSEFRVELPKQGALVAPH